MEMLGVRINLCFMQIFEFLVLNLRSLSSTFGQIRRIGNKVTIR